VGGGFFSGFVPMQVSAAWRLLGMGNGAASLEEMRGRISGYHTMAPGEDPEIGCILIRDPRFFPEDATAAPPPDFATNIMQGKRYDLAERSVAQYFGELMQLLVPLQNPSHGV
jgi:putative restriction endonuclease